MSSGRVERYTSYSQPEQSERAYDKGETSISGRSTYIFSTVSTALHCQLLTLSTRDYAPLAPPTAQLPLGVWAQWKQLRCVLHGQILLNISSSMDSLYVAHTHTHHIT